jgi:transposase
VQRAVESLEDLAQKLQSPRTRYRQEEKVRRAVDKCLAKCGAKEWITYKVMALEEERFLQERRGRPGPDTGYRRVVKVRLHLTFAPDATKLEEAARLDGIFPVVTNDRTLTDAEVLKAYKRQANIEKRFSQLKTQFQITPVFLKSTERVVALLTVYYLALLIQALIERELRRGMAKDERKALPIYPEERDCRAPTARRALDLFDNIGRHELTTPGSGAPAVFPTELSDHQQLVLQLLGISREAYAM